MWVLWPHELARASHKNSSSRGGYYTFGWWCPWGSHINHPLVSDGSQYKMQNFSSQVTILRLGRMRWISLGSKLEGYRNFTFQGYFSCETCRSMSKYLVPRPRITASFGTIRLESSWRKERWMISSQCLIPKGARTYISLNPQQNFSYSIPRMRWRSWCTPNTSDNNSPDDEALKIIRRIKHQWQK